MRPVLCTMCSRQAVCLGADQSLGRSLTAGPSLLAKLQQQAEPLARASGSGADFLGLSQQAIIVLHDWDSRTKALSGDSQRLAESLEAAGIPQLLLAAAQITPLHKLVRSCLCHVQLRLIWPFALLVISEDHPNLCKRDRAKSINGGSSSQVVMVIQGQNPE